MTNTSAPPRKIALARVVAGTPWTPAVRRLEKRRPFVRVVNYHGVPPRLGDSFARHLDQLLTRFGGADGNDLERLLEEGPGDRPAIVFTFDDGLANHLEIVAPRLEERGLRGIFAIPAEFPSIARADQPRWHRERVYPTANEEHKYDEDRLALTWEQVGELAARGHRICSHSYGHRPVDASVDSESYRREIVGSRSLLEAELGGNVPVDGFAWPGPWQNDPAPAAEALVRSTYAYTLQGESRPLYPGHDPHRVYRTNLEPSWPLDVVDLQLSGVVDVYLAVKRLRRRLRRDVTSAGSA
jgi:peptidoglycan/xylan/chitin deacetylase (PgdA/CDA1 family)